MVTKKVVSNKVVNTVKNSSPAKTPKKVTTKESAKGKKLVVAVDAHCFWTKDGHVLKDLRDLESALKKMPAEVFSHHVTKEKNDFATWVETILKDKTCAVDLRKAKKTTSAKTAITKHLKNYVK